MFSPRFRRPGAWERPAVVPRKPKLIAAAAVLTVGVCAAWPWKLGDTVPASVLPIATPTSAFEAVPTPASQPAPPAAPAITATTLGMAASPPGGLISTGSPAPSPATAAAPPVTAPDLSAPANMASMAPPIEPPHRTHVVHEGDSLERLAERYLGDAGRAIEIFDLNREALANPHLLTLGTELKIPEVSDSAAAPVTP